MKERTPNQIRDEAIKCFNQLAPAKYNAGQKEHGGNLDKRKDVINDLRGEAIDFWFYVETEARQKEELEERIEELEEWMVETSMRRLKEKDERIEFLEKQLKHYKEIASR